MADYTVQHAKVVLQGSNILINGDLNHPDQFQALRSALAEVGKSIESLPSITIDLVKCEDCISLLLNPFLAFFKEVPKTKERIVLRLATEENELLPWHHTFLKCMTYVNPGSCEIEVDRQEL